MTVTACTFRRTHNGTDESGVAIIDNNGDVTVIIGQDGMPVSTSDMWTYKLMAYCGCFTIGPIS